MGYPQYERELEKLKLAVSKITSHKGLVPLVIPPQLHTTPVRHYTYEGIPPQWGFVGLFEGNRVKDGDSGMAVVIWFGDDLTPDLTQVTAELEAQWATYAKDVYW
jgi:hypothetical protein